MFILRPYLLHKEVGFSYLEVYKCIFDCFKPIIISGIIAFVLFNVFGEELWQQVLLFVTVLLLTCTIVWFSMEKAMRNYISQAIKSKIDKIK